MTTLTDIPARVACAALVASLFAAPLAVGVAQGQPPTTPAVDPAPVERTVRLATVAPAPEPAPQAPAPKPSAPTPEPTPTPTQTTAAPAPTEPPAEVNDTSEADDAPPAATPTLRARRAPGPPSGGKKRKTTRKRGCDQRPDGVEQLDAHTWKVDRALIQRHTASLKQLNSLGWSKPWRDKDSGEKGWQIGGFGCGSPLLASGLRPRDVIQSVNGRKTNTIPQILGIWTSWKRQDSFEVRVRRGDQAIVLHYVVV